MTAFLMALPDRRLVVFTLSLLGLGLVTVHGATTYEATQLDLLVLELYGTRAL